MTYLCYPAEHPRCPEHGRRCANPDCDRLCAGFDEWQWRDSESEPMRHYCDKACFAQHRRAPLELDPYKFHDAEVERRLRSHNRFVPGLSLDELARASMLLEDGERDQWKEAQTGIRQLSPRERLIAGLQAEHVKTAESTGLLHPLSNWSGRNPGRRSR